MTLPTYVFFNLAITGDALETFHLYDTPTFETLSC